MIVRRVVWQDDPAEATWPVERGAARQFTVFGWALQVLNLFGLDLAIAVTPIMEMQLSQLWHTILGLVMIALILAHIYIATLGMEGAFDAMGTGMVDENWAKEHHSLWAPTQDAANPADD